MNPWRKETDIESRIEEELSVLKPEAARDPKAAERGKAQFLAQAKEMRAHVSPGFFSRLNGWISGTFIGLRKERSPMFGTFSAILLALVLTFGGSGAAVFAAQGSMPEDMLYPLKLTSEDARLAFANSNQSQVDLLNQFLARRYDEVEQLLAKGEDIPKEVADRLQLQLEAQLHLAIGLGDDEMLQTLTQLRMMLQIREQKMSMTGQPDDVNPQLDRIRTMTQEHLRLAELGLEDPNMLQEQLRLRQNQPDEPPQGPPEDGNGAGNGGVGPKACEDCTCTPNGPQGPQGTQQFDGNGSGGPNNDSENGQNGPNNQGTPTPEPPGDQNGGSDNGQNGPNATPEPPQNNDGENGGNGEQGKTQEPDNKGGNAGNGENGGDTGGNGENGGNGGKP